MNKCFRLISQLLSPLKPQVKMLVIGSDNPHHLDQPCCAGVGYLIRFDSCLHLYLYLFLYTCLYLCFKFCMYLCLYLCLSLCLYLCFYLYFILVFILSFHLSLYLFLYLFLYFCLYLILFCLCICVFNSSLTMIYCWPCLLEVLV